ncbi:unnamed protein product [Soboliphyme baturini]|uniref:Uncharacterized protein n=1 Tax=Soboliphyme baturini TaxID=241478 RepID=A0A183ITA9_9BILA|nr:unnamed protein product [Soboliphyme baturini]
MSPALPSFCVDKWQRVAEKQNTSDANVHRVDAVMKRLQYRFYDIPDSLRTFSRLKMDHRSSFSADCLVYAADVASYPHHQTNGWLLILIPYDRDDPQKVFTMELRSKAKHDRAIPRSSILIHQIEEHNGIREEQHKRKVGSERCADGYVRYALNFDISVCVTDGENLMLMKQDWRWRQYQSFYYLLTYGLNMCIRGYVWREIDPYDYRTRSDGECVSGYVMRNAFPGDFVCVSPHDKQQASEDNMLNELRLRYFKFFNGVDEVSYNSKVFPATLSTDGR